MKSEKREVPLKNYFIALLVVLGVVLLTIYFKASYNLKEELSFSQSVLSRTIGEIKYDEIDNVFLEVNGDYFIYISYSRNAEVNRLEKKLKEIIINQELQNNFYYLNVSDMNEKNLIMELNQKLNLTKEKINKLPTILYYEDGVFKDLITSDNDDLISVDEIKDLINEMK